MMPAISIILPVYNSNLYLRLAINSLLDQTFTNFELILIDDGSTDGSSLLCDEYAMLDSRIIVIHQSNVGICAARNVGLEISRGKYISFFDHDDECLPTMLEDSIYLAESQNADWIKFGKCIKLIESETLLKQYNVGFEGHKYTKDSIVSEFLSLKNNSVFENVWNALFKKEIIDRNNIKFNTNFKSGGEDLDFCLQYAIYVHTLITINNEYYIHYIRRGFSTSSTLKVNLKQLYSSLGMRLYEVLNSISYDIDKNLNLYNYTIFNTCILPTIFYQKRFRLSKVECLDFYIYINDQTFILDSAHHIKFAEMFKYAKALTPFVYLFYHKKYNLLWDLMRIRSFLFDIKINFNKYL
jgi:glycosyltransferase involved in cell wall biosynthesis